MNTVSFLLALALSAVVGACVVLWLQLRRRDEAQNAMSRLGARALESEALLLRRLQVAAHDVRGLGMTLHGHADQLADCNDPQAPGIATAAADLMDLADDLQDHTMPGATVRVLREETVSLGDALDDAIAAVSASIVPGRRQWRVAPAAKHIKLRADRRALRHALTRVLADAVRTTRQDDWIDISTHLSSRGLAVVIADEGIGTVRSSTDTRGSADSRGIGLRLTLARALMEAHGGHLDIEAWTGVGTRVSMIFPTVRLLRDGAVAAG